VSQRPRVKGAVGWCPLVLSAVAVVLGMTVLAWSWQRWRHHEVLVASRAVSAAAADPVRAGLTPEDRATFLRRTQWSEADVNWFLSLAAARSRVYSQAFIAGIGVGKGPKPEPPLPMPSDREMADLQTMSVQVDAVSMLLSEGHPDEALRVLSLGHLRQPGR
jgi:hypothetical protein